LRRRWPEVLDAVRRERKVAWMLLSPAAVESLEGGVLTVAFAREGDAKGFVTRGHGQVLTSVLGSLLGLTVRVRGVVGSGVAPRPAGPAPGTAHSRGGTAQDADAPPRGPHDVGGEAEGGGSAAAGHGQAAAEAHGTATPSRAENPTGSGIPSPHGTGTPGRPVPAAPDDGGQSRGRGRSSASGGASARRQRSRGTPPAAQSADPASEEWPDDAGEPARGAAFPTGMELIERQLGGRVIEEIDEP
jgi:DNA polymerase-3 subunit gamma/tau